MTTVKFNFSCGSNLTYYINSSNTAKTWLMKLKYMRLQYLLRTDLNCRHGFATKSEIENHIATLMSLCSSLGIQTLSPTISNWREILNLIHVNFPDFKFTGGLKQKYKLHTMNLLIHWLEYELGNTFNNNNQFSFNVDFNHAVEASVSLSTIDKNELNMFSPYLDFGTLHLHYVYIGRHFLEMFNAYDMVCPKRHFKSQLEFNATCGLVLSETKEVPDKIRMNDDMLQYYQNRGAAPILRYGV